MKTLEICRNFFVHLNTLGVPYCHWKSNEHLDEALAGNTDLDLLVYEKEKDRFQKVLMSFQFKRIISPPEKQFKGLEDYLGFDYETGGFVHLHVHYRLVLGQKYIKNHHLPLEELFFKNLTIKNNVFIPCPELELILLIIRAHMKVDLLSLAKHLVKDMMSIKYTAFPSDIEVELTVLIANSDINKLKFLLKESRLPLEEKTFIDFIDTYSRGQLRFSDIANTELTILDKLKDYRRTRSIAIYLRYFKFFISELPIGREFKPHKRKTLDGSGKIIAIVGADGSGKSTIVKDLQKWLSWKLSVKQYYYGIPKNMMNRLTYYIRMVLKKLGFDKLDKLIGAHFWIYTAKKRLSVYIKSQHEANEGKVVITDRFPLQEFHVMEEPMDGPRLYKCSQFAGSNLAKREAEIYNDISRPDLIIVLQVGINELRKRKSNLPLEIHSRKAQAVNSLKGNGSIKLIDASLPYNEVILDIKRYIWKVL